MLSLCLSSSFLTHLTYSASSAHVQLFRNCFCLADLNDAKGIYEFRRFVERCAHTAVTLLGQVYSAFNSFWLNIMASKDVLNLDLHKNPWMLFDPLTVDSYLVASDILALLAQDRDHVHPGASRQPNQQQFHRAKTQILSASSPLRIERNGMD